MKDQEGGSGVALLVVGLGVLALFLFMRAKERKPPPAQSTNEETWEWTDWQGRQRNVTVHRQVKQE